MTNADKMMLLSMIRQVELERVSTWMLERMIDDLNSLRSEIAAAVTRIDVTGAARADHRRSRLERLLDEIDAAVKRVFDAIEARLIEEVEEMQDVQADDEKRNWLLIYGLTFAGAVDGTARQTLVFGAPLADEVRRISDDLARRAAGLARQSAANLEPSLVLAGKIAGDAKSGVPSLTRPSESAIERLVRTTSSATGNKAASDVAPHGAAKLPALHWVHISVLDSRTSIPCRQRAFKRWDEDKKPIGHSLPFQEPPIYPPEHPCRSRLQRYFEGDAPPTERSFKQTVALLSKAQQESVFGASALALWRKGLLTDSQLIRQVNRPLSLDALRKITQTKGDTQKEFPYL